MPIIKVLAEHLETGEAATFFVDNVSLRIATEPMEPTPIITMTKVPGKRGPFSVVKIQLGLGCNFDCSYCSQKEMLKSREFTPKDVAPFLEKLALLELKEDVKFELWGGEPFVYWKTLKPLTERLKDVYPKSMFQVITNGSLLDHEKIDWLFDMGFSVAVSHDGPGQAVRGADPFVDKRDVFAYAIQRLAPLHRFSISSMLHKDNASRTAIIAHFKALFPEFEEFHLSMSEMGFIDSYNTDGNKAVSLTRTEHFELRRNLWSELRWIAATRQHCYGQDQDCAVVMTSNFQDARTPVQPGQKCGMFAEDRIVLDVSGNVLTCQNVSSETFSHNGESHKIGHVSQLDQVRLKTAIHWTQRDGCSTCPVLRLCKGSCMFLTGDDFSASCEIAYTDKITQFAIGFEQVTGFVPVKIESEGLPLHRQDIWGTSHALDKQPAKRRVIPIKAMP